MKIKKAKQRRVHPPAEFKIVRLRECPAESPTLDTPTHVEKFWRECVATSPQFDPERETFVVFMLNTRKRFTGFQILSHGTKDTILVGTGEVFRLAVMHNAARIVIAHNHPSGDPPPSEADVKVTRALLGAGELINIELLDHVIIGDARREKGYASLRELGYIHADDAEPADQAQAADGAATPEKKPASFSIVSLEETVYKACSLIDLFQSKLADEWKDRINPKCPDFDQATSSSLIGCQAFAREVKTELSEGVKALFKAWRELRAKAKATA